MGNHTTQDTSGVDPGGFQGSPAYPRLWYGRGLWLALIVVILPSLTTAAPPPAGTILTVQATATYQDSVSGLFSTLSSNVINVIVQPLEALTLVQDQTVVGAPSVQTYFSHRVSNTGNTVTSYQLSYTNLPGDSFDLTFLSLTEDQNGNGFPDSGEPIIPNGGTVTLSQGQTMDVVLTAVVPSAVSSGDFADCRLDAVSVAQGAMVSNIDRVIINGGTVLTGFQSVTPQNPNPTDTVTLTLSGSNVGTVTADPSPITVDGLAQSRVVLREPIPVNTTYSAMVASGTSAVVYHQIGNPLHTYVTAQPSPNLIDAVGYTYPNIVPAQAFSLSLAVTVNANASGSANKTGVLYYRTGTTDTSVNTNTAVLTFGGNGPNVAYFTDGTYSSQSGLGTVGTPLFVQADAATCNLDPLAADTIPITVTSVATSDMEIFTATETGINSGFFRIMPNIQTQDSAMNPVTPGNGLLEVTANDEVTASLSGCGASVVTATILIDPAGVVFNTRNNHPVQGVTVALIDVSGAGNGGIPGGPATVFQADGVTSAPSSVLTVSDGRFEFPLVPASTYRLEVIPGTGFAFPSTLPVALQPPGRTIHPSGSFGGTFQVNLATGPVKLDVPMDPAFTGGLFVEKTASKEVVELADFVDYTVKVINQTGEDLLSFRVTDNLPAGFAFLPGTARTNGRPRGNPQGGGGPRVLFQFDRLNNNQSLTFSYRVRVGPGALQGDGMNRAQAVGVNIFDVSSTSNIATVTVKVIGGIFSERGFIVGKVFTDCNQNRMQDPGEVGIPGVRLYMEDGTYSITDREGKYTFFGVLPMTHVVKVDPMTLPPGSSLIPLVNRHAGDGGSRFVDLKKGELHQADFAIGRCSAETIKAIETRRTERDVTVDDMEKSATPRPQGNAEGSGLSTLLEWIFGADGETVPAPLSRYESNLPDSSVDHRNQPLTKDRSLNGDNSNLPPAPVHPSPFVPFDALLPTMDPTLDFLDVKDGDTLPLAQTNVRVKGLAGSPMTLLVNGTTIPPTRVGTKSVLPSKQVEAWEYIGIDLQPGHNILEVRQVDNFGITRRKQVTVIAPGPLAQLHLRVPEEGVAADGHTPAIITVELTDEQATPVTVRTLITLEATVGTWRVEDVNEQEPGVQVFLEGGQAEFLLLSPHEPAESRVRVTSGILEAEQTLTFVPNLRPMIMVGLLEGVLDLRKLDPRTLVPAREQDGFERELEHFSDNDNGTLRAGGRAAFFLKGKIPGDALLTMGFDSDKETTKQLFRDIQPDEFYPVYGDASVKGFDAQTTGRLYVRVDKDASYLLYGDYTTLSGNAAQTLGRYSRSLTGVKGHYENKHLRLNVWGARDNFRQVVEEIPALGISGPYFIGQTDVVVNSEKVEIVTRDRNQTSLIVNTEPQTRFSDYAFEALAGRILFKAPIASRDSNLNPISIRVTYEVQEDDARKFWIAGIDGQIKLTEGIEIGGAYARDDNPQDPYQLASGTVTLQLADKTFLMGEVAQSDQQSLGTGNAGRLELRHQGETLQARVYVGDTERNFKNPLASLGPGRWEAAAKTSYRLTPQTRILGEAIHTEDKVTRGRRDGVLAGVEHTFENNIRVETGFRYGKETTAPSQLSSLGGTPLDLLTARAKLSAPVPYVPRLTISGDFEQDVSSSARAVGVGGEYQFTTRGRAYLRHEVLSSLSGRYALNGNQTQDLTVVGVDTDYMNNGQVFSEYRASDAFSGRETQAAIGLRNTWHLAEGLTANTRFERVQDFGGSSATQGNAVALALAYTRDPSWKGTARIEKRFDSARDDLLNQFGLGVKMSKDWTFLGKNTLSVTEMVSGDALLEHLRVGFAYRNTDTNRWNALGRYEFKYEDDPGQAGLGSLRQVHIVGTDVTFHPIQPLTMMGGYAFKWVSEDSLGVNSDYSAHLVQGRITYDMTDRWDLGVLGSTLFSGGYESAQHSVGVELGRLVANNAWVSVGYNFFGFQDRDLYGQNSTNQGVFLRFRVKFDENLFGLLR